MKIAFVGGGHIAAAIVAGLRASERADEIIVADRNPGKRRKMRAQFAAAAVNSAHELPADVDVLILAVKPADLRAACRQIAPQRRAIAVSVAAGASLATIAAAMPFAPRHLARAMPNTPLAAGEGMCVCYAEAPAAVKRRIGAIFASAGKVLWARNESMLAAAAAVSGCGPAYLYYLAEAMEETAAAMGFSAAESRLLVSQTLRGGGAMLRAPRASAVDLRRAVAVPGGATESAVAAMQDRNFKQIIKDAMRAARKRADEIGEQIARQTADD